MLLFASAVRLVSALDEEAEWNPLAEARRRGESLERIFGGAPGVYGAGAAALMLDQDWTAREDIGGAYLGSSSHAYDGGGDGVPARRQFKTRVAEADALVHVQDDRERDVLDGDGVADYAGGFAAAAAALGRLPPFIISTRASLRPPSRAPSRRKSRASCAGGSPIRAGSIRCSSTAIAASRKWPRPSTRSSHLRRPTPRQATFSTQRMTPFSADEAFADALRQANPAATEAMAGRLFDALRRGLWTPRRNAVSEELARVAPRAAAKLKERNIHA